MIPHSIFARSQFSIGESMMDLGKLVENAEKCNASHIILTDTMTISGMIGLTRKCEGKGIKPIIGVRLRVIDDATYRPPKKSSGEKPVNQNDFYPKLYALTDQGVRIILKLLTEANKEENFYRVPRLSLQTLIDELDPAHVALSTGDAQSLFGRKDAMSVLQKIKDALGALKTFVELCPVDTPLHDRLNKMAIDAANDMGLSVLVNYPALYDRGNADTMDVLNAISRNVKMKDTWAWKPHIRDFHPKAVGEIVADCMAAKDRLEKRYPGLDQGSIWKQALSGGEKLATMTTFKWAPSEVSLPKMADDEAAEVVKECKIGWKKRFGTPVFGHQPTVEDQRTVYLERLQYELGVLKKMGFCGYFLLVQDIVQWSKSNGIAVGPGRGSVGGSLVSYLMGISDVDPIRFNLIFERFINPDRLDLPDIDLDFASERRHEVIEYVTKKYGEDRVAGISNYGTLASASALRDAGRVYNMDPKRELSVSKLVPKPHGQPMPLEEAAKEVPELENFRNQHREVWRHAVHLEGAMRSLGRHAAGVVVAGEPLVNRAVVERRGGEPTINWDKRVAEDQGLVKLDVLGLSTLDILKLAVQNIWKRHSKKIDMLTLPLADEKVLKKFGKGETVGVFQFEGGGMRKLLKNLSSYEPLTFEDVTAATALYRPGPMDAGLMDDYVAIKQGLTAPSYEHPNMEAALKSTYGVIIYQEQVMQVARDLAGFTMTESDHLRKAMGKKDKDKMAQMRDKWVKGCLDHSGMDEEHGGALFDKIEKFAGYGFNLSHAVEYSLISYIAMWLKTYYPVEFFAAALTVTKEEKLAPLIKDAAECGVIVNPPDINISSNEFEILNDTTLCAPFNRVKGVSENTAKAILEARESAGEFASLKHFLEHVVKRKCNARCQQSLIRVGAFARVGSGFDYSMDKKGDIPDYFKDGHKMYAPGLEEILILPANHPDRLRDQLELMPGIIQRNVKADRVMKKDKVAKDAITEVVEGYLDEAKCNLPRPHFGRRAKFMVITDCPTWAEEDSMEFSKGKTFEYIHEALKTNALDREDGYWTALAKAPKADKQLSNDEINQFAPWLDKEIEVLKPPVIICLGSAAARHMVKDLKGGIMDNAGKVIYDATMDASIVVGFNTGMIAFDSAKQKVLNELFKEVAEMVS
jgi:DNA polymerase-3 subunit alpha